MADMWRAAPPMAIMLTVTDLFRFVARDGRGVAIMGALAVLTAAAVAALVGGL